jgi:hypothetical protein
MKAKVNPFYRSVYLSVEQSEEVSIFFDELDEWKSVVINGRMYDINFHYEPLESFRNRQAWLDSLVCVYLLGDWGEEHYSRNLVTDVKIEL